MPAAALSPLPHPSVSTAPWLSGCDLRPPAQCPISSKALLSHLRRYCRRFRRYCRNCILSGGISLLIKALLSQSRRHCRNCILSGGILLWQPWYCGIADGQPHAVPGGTGGMEGPRTSSARGGPYRCAKHREPPCARQRRPLDTARLVGIRVGLQMSIVQGQGPDHRPPLFQAT